MHLPANSGRFWRPAALAAATIWLCLAGTASTANASCGDYVLINGRMAGGHDAPRYESLFPKSSLPDSPAKHPAPCQGPMCSRGDLPGLPTGPVPETKISLERWAYLGLTPTTLLGDSRLKIADGPAPHSILATGDVFRPPRQFCSHG